MTAEIAIYAVIFGTSMIGLWIAVLLCTWRVRRAADDWERLCFTEKEPAAVKASREVS